MGFLPYAAKVACKELHIEVVASFISFLLHISDSAVYSSSFFYNTAKQTSKTKYSMEEALEVCLRWDSDVSDKFLSEEDRDFSLSDSGEEASEEGNVALGE